MLMFVDEIYLLIYSGSGFCGRRKRRRGWPDGIRCRRRRRSCGSQHRLRWRIAVHDAEVSLKMIFDESSVFCSIVKWVRVVAERVEKNETLDNPLYFNSWRFLRKIDGDELKFEFVYSVDNDRTTIEQKVAISTSLRTHSF